MQFLESLNSTLDLKLIEYRAWDKNSIGTNGENPNSSKKNQLPNESKYPKDLIFVWK